MKITIRKTSSIRQILSVLFAALLLSGCSSTRFIHEDETVLSSVKLTSTEKYVKPSAYRGYIRQRANSKWFNLIKVPLGFYCMSGTDSTKRFNRMMHRIGEAPVVYDSTLTNYSTASLKAALDSKGYLNSEVRSDITHKGRRTKVVYSMIPGDVFYIDSIAHTFDNARMDSVVKPLLKHSILYKGMPLDVSKLNEERSRLILALQNKGYYALHNDFISFTADTLSGDRRVLLTMHFACPPGLNNEKAYVPHRLRSVRIYEDLTPGTNADSTTFNGLTLFFQKKPRIYRKVYNNHIFIRKDSLYSETATQNTYSALNALSAVNYSTIHFREADGLTPQLDCDILVKRNRPHTISAELEGTNTAGDLGAAVSLTYANQNIFRGSETFSLKLRGAYEAITGLEGYGNQNYIEYSIESGLRFPSFMFPFLSQQRRQALKATSEVSIMYNSQNRPEFYRRTLTGTWAYRWNRNDNPRLRHRFDLLSLNYIFMPWISDTFSKEYLQDDDPRHAILRYSYEDLFIMKLGYNFVYNSQRTTGAAGLYQTNGYQVKFNVETAGNLLYGFSKLFHASKNANGQYNIFNIAYSQYAKVDFDYSKSVIINDRNSFAFHAGFGLAIPYGNSTIIPYEKRYFSGGANSVRGWSARGLGPGRYIGRDGKVDFINQTGNLKLDFSVEYRTLLFWKLHAAAFIDAGNVWNTRLYSEELAGEFRFNRFYKEIAVSYGLGLRLNFDYFILRFDGGMKAINPTVEHRRQHYPLICPKFSRDFAFHFAVGLPF